MSCKICGRSSCTQSFHSIDEQTLFEQREAMPDDVPLLRRMVQEAASELVELKAEMASETAWAKQYADEAEALRVELAHAREVRDNAINQLIANRQT